MTGLRPELKLHQINRRLIRRNMPLPERHTIIRDLRAKLDDAAQQVGSGQRSTSSETPTSSPRTTRRRDTVAARGSAPA